MNSPTPSNSIAQLSVKLFELLHPLSPEDRQRVVHATSILLGDTPLLNTQEASGSDQSSGERASGGDVRTVSAEAYFNEKEPKTKGEQLAVAARFRELHRGATTHSKDELKAVVQEARRNFDDHNYTRDMDNAKRSAGFFNTGTDSSANTLSYNGKEFIDALPDRDAAKATRRKPRKARKKAAKKKAAKK